MLEGCTALVHPFVSTDLSHPLQVFPYQQNLFNNEMLIIRLLRYLSIATQIILQQALNFKSPAYNLVAVKGLEPMAISL